MNNKIIMENLVKRALKDVPIPKPMKGLVFLETLDRGAKFSLHNRSGTVIHTTPGDVYVEIDSYFADAGDGGEYYVSKHKTHWAGLTQVKRRK